jgi:hypothetical protein
MIAKSLVVLGLAAIGSAFTLPGGQPNGLYRAYYDADGKEVHEFVAADNISLPQALPEREYSRSKREALPKRWDSSQAWCGCAFPMNAADTNNANAILANYAASSPVLDGGRTQYSVQNSAVAFVCNFDSGSVTIPSNLVSNNSPDISYACGNFIAGTSRLEGFADLDYGYMNYLSGLDFCGAAESSTQQICPSSEAGQICSCYQDCKNDTCAGLSGWAYDGCYQTCSTFCAAEAPLPGGCTV